MNFDKEGRVQAKLERLGSNEPQCVVCSESDARCLERHHLPSKKYGNDTVIVCRNCHRKLSDDQRDHPKQIDLKPGIVEIVMHALLGIADLLMLVAEQCRKYAAQLLQSITDEECPA